MHIRPEAPSDILAIRHVNEEAFGTAAEATLVDLLRDEAAPRVSLVADDDGAIVGHIMFSPVTLSTNPQLRIMGLAPMAVLPERQRQGIGTALIVHGLAECRALDAGAVVVLGHPRYYPRFGFVPASAFDIRCEYDVPDDAFMAVELISGFLSGRAGAIRYHAVFGRV